MELLNQEQRDALQQMSSERSVTHKGKIQTTFLKLHCKESNFTGAHSLNAKVKIVLNLKIE